MATYAAVVLAKGTARPVTGVLSLTAEERRKRLLPWQTSEGETVYLELPRGVVLQDEDVLHVPARDWVLTVAARPEPVLTVRASQPLLLLRAAYHLGNRHVPLQITPEWLRLAADGVLADLLREMGLTVTEEMACFYPEMGAYHHH
ncbi:MAG: urease accessory protein UreE [Gloeomargarita sp. GMQP_bins_5]